MTKGVYKNIALPQISWTGAHDLDSPPRAQGRGGPMSRRVGVVARIAHMDMAEFIDGPVTIGKP